MVKTRNEEGALQSSVSGTYKIIIPADTEGLESHLLYLEITFGSKTPIVANCRDNSVEHLVMADEHYLVNSWVACDGLSMHYAKID